MHSSSSHIPAHRQIFAHFMVHLLPAAFNSPLPLLHAVSSTNSLHQENETAAAAPGKPLKDDDAICNCRIGGDVPLLAGLAAISIFPCSQPPLPPPPSSPTHAIPSKCQLPASHSLLCVATEQVLGNDYSSLYRRGGSL